LSSGEESKKSDLYLRRASGLIRTAGPWSGLAFNVIWTGNSVGIIAAFILSAYVFVSPGQNIVFLIVLATLLSVLNAATYMFFSMAMPRSGGDYHFISRTLHPALGFMSSVNWALWMPLVLGFAGSVFVPIALESLLKAWGVATGNPAIIQFADSLSGQNTVFLIGAVVIIIFTLITILGTRVYFAIQNAAFVLMILALLITVAAFLSMTPASYAAAIDKALGAGTYNSTIQTFESNYPSIQRPLSVAVLSGIVLWAGINTWAMGSSLIAGEIKQERKLRTWMIANILGTLVTGGIMALTAFLFLNSVGQKFVYAMSYLSGSADYKLVFPPYYSSFIPIAFPNIIIFIIFAVGFFLGGTFFMPQNQILASRVMLAWSFDRLMPRQLGQVDKRFHAPLIATAICGVVSLVSLWVYVYTPYLGFFSQLFAVAFSFLVTSIAAIVFPFRKKEMFESSPANIKIAGVPLMALIGVANTIFMLVFIYQNWTDAALGSNSPQSVALILGILVISFVLYWVIRAFRKRQGIDIDALYREIPPE
jgi:APA family basic amino acid/polyamine antiporter